MHTKTTVAAPLRMLVVDDAPLSRKLHESYGRLSGFQVDSAEDGLQAVAAVRAKLYHCIVTDIEMPVLDGLAATRRIRALEAETGRAAATIIAVTGTEMADVCHAAGVDHFVSKLEYARLQQLLVDLADTLHAHPGR